MENIARTFLIIHKVWATLATVRRLFVGGGPQAHDQPQSRRTTMTRRKSMLGALCLCALSICAFAAFGVSNAAAMTMHECLEATGTGVKYTDNTCTTESGTGKFQTVPIELGKSVALEPTLTPTGTPPVTHAVLTSTVAGIEIEITCTALSSTNTVAKNVAGNIVEGSGNVTFTGCGLVRPEKQECTVKGGGGGAGTIITNLLSTKTEGMNTKFTPPKEKAFVEIEFSGCKTAALNGTKPVNGFVNGVQTTPTSQTFNSGAGELTFGGQVAHFIATVHYKTKGTSTLVALETNSEGK
jgi:hypothetical protein